MDNTSATNVQPNHDVNVDKKVYTFGFRTVEDADTGTKTKRPSIELSLPIPSLEGIAAILTSGDEKQQSLLIEAVAQIVVDAARDQLNDNAALTAESFDFSKVTFESIANQEIEARKSRAISKEAWEDFSTAYITHMVSTTAAPKKQVELQVKHMVGKFNVLVNHADRERILGGFKEQLTVFTATYPEAEAHAAIIDYLNGRIKKIIESGPIDVASALGF